MIIETTKLLIDGNSLADIKEYLKTQGIEDPEKIINQAFENLLIDQDISKEIRQAWCIEAYREIYRKLIETGDYNGAIKAIKEISALSNPKKKKREETNDKVALSDLNKKRLSIVRK